MKLQIVFEFFGDIEKLLWLPNKNMLEKVFISVIPKKLNNMFTYICCEKQTT